MPSWAGVVASLAVTVSCMLAHGVDGGADAAGDGHSHSHAHEHVDLYQLVTCGSAVKLTHPWTKSQLHSHSVAWGSGSKQQSVTATPDVADSNSLWLVKEAQGGLELGSAGPTRVAADGRTMWEPCEHGAPIACSSFVRLEHLRTGSNLHSHGFTSPLTQNQEVSAFGSSGAGDTGDNWKVVCMDNAERYWKRGNEVRLTHQDTGRMLATMPWAEFTARNCPGCPIHGQLEVSGVDIMDKGTFWVADFGMYWRQGDRVPYDGGEGAAEEEEEAEEAAAAETGGGAA